MAKSRAIISCRFCGRRYYKFDHRCPDCRRRSRRGWVATGLMIASIVAGVAVTVFLSLKVVNATFEDSRKREPMNTK